VPHTCSIYSQAAFTYRFTTCALIVEKISKNKQMGKLIQKNMAQGAKPVALAICLTALVAAATYTWMSALDASRARVDHAQYNQPEAEAITSIINVPMAARGDVLEEKKIGNPMAQSQSCTVGVAVLLRNENHALLEWFEHYLAEVSVGSSN
jgi:hypothetical protein